MFLQARDLTSWSATLRGTMSAAPRVRDVSAAQALRADHDAVKAEIEARDDTFRNALELGGALVQGGHRNAQVICYLLFTGVYYKQFFFS